MNLIQLSVVYHDSALTIGTRIRELQRAEAAAPPEEAQQMHRRIVALRPMLTEANELSAMLAHYYERGYHKNEKYSL
ncbi:MAG: hypothetical protein GXW99_03785 [Clostridiales bacterium]|nr:hypothetical protein [Clostridiales bacterium]